MPQAVLDPYTRVLASVADGNSFDLCFVSVRVAFAERPVHQRVATRSAGLSCWDPCSIGVVLTSEMVTLVYISGDQGAAGFSHEHKRTFDRVWNIRVWRMHRWANVCAHVTRVGAAGGLFFISICWCALGTSAFSCDQEVL